MVLSRAKLAGFLFAILLLLGAGSVLIAMLPASWLKGRAEQALSDRLGRSARIGRLERESAFSFAPVLRVGDIEIPQAAWAGDGALASIRDLRVRIAIVPALLGRADPEILSASGVRLNLVRGADRRVNWRKDGAAGASVADDFPLDRLGSVDAIVRYRDAFQKRNFNLALRVLPGIGLTVAGRGDVDGHPVTVTAQGPALRPGAPWSFSAAISGNALAMRARGTMAGPMRLDDMRFRVTARAADLKLIDRIIEAGLFGTQEVDISADVRHEPRRWTVTGLAGTIGTSPLTGRIVVDKREKRTRLDGFVHFGRLDFDDLASDSGLAAALALERAEGPKLVPDTRIDIRRMANTDGRIAFRIDRIVGQPPSALRAASGVLTLDRRLLVASALRLQLSKGIVDGEARVDQRAGQAAPTLTLKLDLRGSSIGALAAGDGGEVDAPVEGRVRIAGVGDTIRQAVGNSRGTIGLAAGQGSLPARMAALLGFDVGRSLLAGKDKRATLRCAILRLDMNGGVGRMAPLVVDTSRSQARGAGTIAFPQERISATITGAPKHGIVLRLPGAIAAGGTIRNPSAALPRRVKSFGNVLKAVGRALTGRQGPEARDADCAALRRQAIGR